MSHFTLQGGFKNRGYLWQLLHGSPGFLASTPILPSNELNLKYTINKYTINNKEFSRLDIFLYVSFSCVCLLGGSDSRRDMSVIKIRYEAAAAVVEISLATLFHPPRYCQNVTLVASGSFCCTKVSKKRKEIKKKQNKRTIVRDRKKDRRKDKKRNKNERNWQVCVRITLNCEKWLFPYWRAHARPGLSMRGAISDCEIVASNHTYSSRIRKQWEGEAKERRRGGWGRKRSRFSRPRARSSHCRSSLMPSASPLFRTTTRGLIPKGQELERDPRLTHNALAFSLSLVDTKPYTILYTVCIFDL